jgi:hypothetical protein
MRFASIFSEDTEVWTNMVIYYLRPIILCGFVTALIGMILVYCKRKCVFYNTWQKASFGFLCFVPILVLTIYCLLTVKRSYVSLSLDSENANTAALTYHGTFQAVTLPEALNLATNQQEWDNVRFYAACHVADILATNSSYAIKDVLDQVKGAPKIKPIFFGKNDVNASFFVSGMSYGPFSVTEIIEKRLNDKLNALEPTKAPIAPQRR